MTLPTQNLNRADHVHHRAKRLIASGWRQAGYTPPEVYLAFRDAIPPQPRCRICPRRRRQTTLLRFLCRVDDERIVQAIVYCAWCGTVVGTVTAEVERVPM